MIRGSKPKASSPVPIADAKVGSKRFMSHEDNDDEVRPELNSSGRAILEELLRVDDSDEEVNTLTRETGKLAMHSSSDSLDDNSVVIIEDINFDAPQPPQMQSSPTFLRAAQIANESIQVSYRQKIPSDKNRGKGLSKSLDTNAYKTRPYKKK